jgi:hypothetical protein
MKFSWGPLSSQLTWVAITILVAGQGVVNSPSRNGSAPVTPGAQPVTITLTPRTLDFGTQKVGTTGAPLTATVSNQSSAALKITDVIPSGIDFRETDNCRVQLAPGATCVIEVKFTPAITGQRDGSVTILDSVSLQPHTLVLTGVGQ